MYNRKRWFTAVALALVASALIFAAGAAFAAAPQNTKQPKIKGNAAQGETLTADPGRWSGTKPIQFSYQWRRCDAAGGTCVNIAQATDRRYTPQSDDVGRRLRVVVSATNNDGTGTAVSDPTAVVKGPAPLAPRNTAAPSISGRLVVGDTLTANPGTWTGSQPIEFSYRWRRCDNKGDHCADTPVTAQTYRLGPDDVGKTLRVLVTARNAAGTRTELSRPTAVVGGTAPPPACVGIGGISLPERLVVDRIQYSPPRIHSRAVPLVARFHVTTTAGRCVQGALVYAVGVPFDRLSKVGETATGSDGWAQVTFRILPTFRLRPGNLVVIFVRARKPGENLLAGVSTRRLVSVRVG